jgi:hypothetical protein
MAYALEINLNITLIEAIGWNYLIESAPGTLGIRDKTPKLSLEMSSLPRENSLRIFRSRGLSQLQHDLKKNTEKPSGPGAVSVLVWARTSSSYWAVKESAISWFSAFETL